MPTGPIGESDLLAASLAVVVHGKESGIDAIMEVLAQALDKAGPKKKAEFAGYVGLGLKGLAAEKKWRDLVALNAEMLRSSSVFAEILDDERVEGRAEGEAKGEVKGEAKSILKLLAFNGVRLTDSERDRIRVCTDEAQLDRWLTRAATATSSAELFD